MSLDSGLLYQRIMHVPGLTGTWRQRLDQYHRALTGRAYDGSRDQGMFMLNAIGQRNFPQAQTTQAPQQQEQAPVAAPQEQIAQDTLKNIQPNTDIYSEDVMKQDAWFDPFDEWTRNFVETQMRPEWERDVYEPAMKEMNQALYQSGQSMGASGGYRHSGMQKSLKDMAENAMKQEETMRRDFQDSTVDVRDAIRSQLAAPLYRSNMQRWGDSPWGNINTQGADMNEIAGNLQGTLGGESLEDLLNRVGNWTPDASGGGTQRDWRVQPHSNWTPNLFSQYAQRY